MSATYWKYDSSVGQPPPSAAIGRLHLRQGNNGHGLSFSLSCILVIIIIIEPGKSNTWQKEAEKEAAKMAAVAAHLFLSVGHDVSAGNCFFS